MLFIESVFSGTQEQTLIAKEDRMFFTVGRIVTVCTD
jgi:hypothetical protein